MTSNLHDELQALVDADARTELECRRYLKYVREMLIDQTSHEVIHESAEYRGHSGNSDYVIVCRVKDGTGGEAIKAYVWETKAPQCFIFEADTENRVSPTADFVSAENQLLHYYEDLRGSDQFREEFRIVHPDNVSLGGIIIGCARTRVYKSRYDERTLETLFARALNLRRKHLYGHVGIKVLSWDRLVEFLKTRAAPPQNPGMPDTVISIGTGELSIQANVANAQN